MICPTCGCQQREADICVQCHAPLSEKKVKEPGISSSENRQRPFDTLTPEWTEESRSGSFPPFQSLKEPAMKEGSQGILITTTQRIEGKRIAIYYGLIYANVLIGANDPARSESGAEHRKGFKTGVSEALQILRAEATLLKANAIIATSFEYQRIDPKSILLSVIGTAVLVKDR